MVFLQKSIQLSKNIYLKSKVDVGKIHLWFCLFAATCFFFSFIFSLPLYSEDFPLYLRLKPDAKYITLSWERSLAGEEGWAEQKIGEGEWEEVPGLQRKVKVGLALAGGIVRGVAHIGVLRALEENRIPINGISGTSMGSIIGGLYASGYSPDSLEWIVKEDIDWETFFQDDEPREYTPIWERIRNKPRPPAMDVDLTRKPLFISYKPGSGIRIAQKFTDEIADKTLEADYRAGFDFSELTYPFGAILTDLNRGKSKLQIKGTLSTALRASGSFPMAFEPMIIEGTQYVDGGVLDNLPVDAFLPEFDPVRKPDTIIDIYDKAKGEAIYVIASYPSKLRGERDKAVEETEISGLLGLSVLGKTSSLAREFHVWNSWDNADEQIDIDIQGGFDFNKKKIDELIKAGHYAAMIEICDIKKELAAKEDTINPLEKPRKIFRVASVKLFQVKNNDTLKIEEATEVKRIEKAMRFIPERSRIEKNDVCYALRDIYNIGDYKNVGARIDKNKEELHIKFFLTRKDTYSDSIDVKLIMGKNLSSDSLVHKKSDSLVAEKIKERMKKKQRKLSFNEIKELAKSEYIKRGYVAPSVAGAEYSSLEDKDVLFINGNRGKYLKGVKIMQDKEEKKLEIQNEFGLPLSPKKILDKNKEIYKKYQLRTISIESIADDTLLNIRVRPRAGHTLEFPNLSLEKDEGLTLFTELRSKRIREWGNRSLYMNYTQNFPLKLARELPQGLRFEIGVNRYSPLYLSLWSFLPDVSLGCYERMRYPGLPDTNLYDTQYDEYFFGSVSYPVYIRDFALIPGVESSYKRYLNDSLLSRPINGFLRLEVDNLDRFVFPTSGTKVSFEFVFGSDEQFWDKGKIKGIYAWGFKIQDKLTVLTAELCASACHHETPFPERYSMGGITPVGSYQLRAYDYEDLPGYRRDELIEPIMLKFGGSARLALVEKQVLGIQVNLHTIGSFYGAWTCPTDKFSSIFDENLRDFHPSLSAGLYLDTSILNFGIGWANTDGNFYHDLYASVVLYGAGF
jgi:predicted acylesterase/phospholipase RssA